MSDLPADLVQRVLTESWLDPEFREKLMRDPRAALTDLGFDAPADVDIKVVTQSNRELTLLAAENPAGPQLTEELVITPQTNWTSRGGGCGTSCTLTSECFCPSTATGHCICPV